MELEYYKTPQSSQAQPPNGLIEHSFKQFGQYFIHLSPKAVNY